MKKNEISEIIGNINDKYVDEAINYTGKEKKIRHNRIMKWGTIAACLCIALIGAFAIPKLDPSVSKKAGHADTEVGSLHDGELDNSVPDPDSHTPDNKEISEPIPTAQNEIGTTPVYYSDLMLANSILNEEVPDLSESAVSESALLDITSFDESDLSQAPCCMIIEGTVVDLYVKHYNYDIYSDKFEENGILHSCTDTVVYEVAVDKTWFGEDISGGTILIEDTSYFTEPILAVKEGGRYVLPLYEYGNSVWALGHEYAGGDITRETVYSTIYPFHPQIEVTNDGSYVVSQDWTTLAANNAKEIIMDTLDDDDFWKDKMYLVDGKTFEEQMTILISNI